MNDRPRPSRPAAPTGDEDPVDHPDAATRVVDETLAELCAEVLAGAFYDDPLWSWAFPDDDRRLDQHRACWRMCVEGAIRYPWVRLTADGAATAVWIPPGGTEMTDEGAERLEALIVELLGPGGGERSARSRRWRRRTRGRSSTSTSACSAPTRRGAGTATGCACSPRR